MGHRINQNILIFSVAVLFLMAQLSFAAPYAVPIADGAPRIIFGNPHEALSSGDYLCPGDSQATLSVADYPLSGCAANTSII